LAGLGYQCDAGLHIEVELWRSQMAVIAKVISRPSETRLDVEALQNVAIFSGVGLAVSLFLMLRGLDLSAGFF
jgi:hypothetical protein